MQHKVSKTLNIMASTARYPHVLLGLSAQVVGQAHILQEAFAPTTNRFPLQMETNLRQLAAADAPTYTLSVLIICMDGGNVSREDRVRVRVSLSGDSDDWKESERFGGVPNPAAVSGVGVVDEEAAVCRWDRPGGSTREVRAQDNFVSYDTYIEVLQIIP